jgi:hypothetical protein
MTDKLCRSCGATEGHRVSCPKRSRCLDCQHPAIPGVSRCAPCQRKRIKRLDRQRAVAAALDRLGSTTPAAPELSATGQPGRANQRPAPKDYP